MVPGNPAEWFSSIRTVIWRYCGDCIEKSGTYRATGASREILPWSTNCMTAIVVRILLTDPTPNLVVAVGFLPALLMRPKVWLHTVLPPDTRATDADVDWVSFNAARMAWRPALIVVLKDSCLDFFAVACVAWTGSAA